MNVLFDHGTPAPLRTFLKDHTVKDAKSQGWDTFGNGDLLVAAETAGFDVLLTTDRNIRYQQNLASLDFHSAGKRLTVYGARLRTAPMWGSPAPFALVTSSTDPTQFALPASSCR